MKRKTQGSIDGLSRFLTSTVSTEPRSSSQDLHLETHRAREGENPAKFICKHTADSGNVQMKEEDKREKKNGRILKDVRLAPTRSQNLSISTASNRSVVMVMGVCSQGVEVEK